jgi:hypothetical protein
MSIDVQLCKSFMTFHQTIHDNIRRSGYLTSSICGFFAPSRHSITLRTSTYVRGFPPSASNRSIIPVGPDPASSNSSCHKYYAGPLFSFFLVPLIERRNHPPFPFLSLLVHERSFDVIPTSNIQRLQMHFAPLTPSLHPYIPADPHPHSDCVGWLIQATLFDARCIR